MGNNLVKSTNNLVLLLFLYYKPTDIKTLIRTMPKHNNTNPMLNENLAYVIELMINVY